MTRGKGGIRGARRAMRRRGGAALAVAFAAFAGAAGCGEQADGGDGDGGDSGDGDGEGCESSTIIDVDLETEEATVGPNLNDYAPPVYRAGEDTWALTDQGMRLVTTDGLSEPMTSRAAVADFADLDSDGDLDIVAARGTSFRVFAREGDELQLLETQTATATGNSTHVVVAEANDDGHLDVLAVTDGALRVYAGDGQLGFELASSPGGGGDNMRWVGAGDVNDDGSIEVIAVVTPISTPVGEPDEVFLSVWVGEGGGAFAAPQRIGLGLRSIDGFATHLIDVDSDGFLDLVVREGRRLLVAAGDSTGALSPARQLTADLEPPAGGPEVIEPDDRDGDGVYDFLVLSDGSLRRVADDGQGQLVVKTIALPAGQAHRLARRVSSPVPRAIQVLVHCAPELTSD